MGTVVVGHVELFAGELTNTPVLDDTVKATLLSCRRSPALLTSWTVRVYLPGVREKPLADGCSLRGIAQLGAAIPDFDVIDA